MLYPTDEEEDMAELLSDEEIGSRLQASPWKREGEHIVRDWELQNFKQAIQFVNEVADVAEAANHHPDIIVHGTALWALAGREIVAAHGGGDSGRLARLACRFSAMVVPGTTVTLEHAPSADPPRCIGFTMRNEAGAAALTRGVAELRPP